MPPLYHFCAFSNFLNPSSVHFLSATMSSSPNLLQQIQRGCVRVASSSKNVPESLRRFCTFSNVLNRSSVRFWSDTTAYCPIFLQEIRRGCLRVAG
jgi:hypothetical protein